MRLGWEVEKWVGKMVLESQVGTEIFRPLSVTERDLPLAQDH